MKIDKEVKKENIEWVYLKSVAKEKEVTSKIFYTAYKVEKKSVVQ